MKTFDDDVYYDEDEADDDESDQDTQPCPYCHRQIYEDAERCPHCEQYITDFERKKSRNPTWIVVTAVVLIALTLYWYVAPLL